MSSKRNQDELIELLASYAINAVDDEERAEVEAFLQGNPEYLDEVNEYQSAAALLAIGHSTVPDAVWERIQSRIEPSAPPLRLVDEQQSEKRTVRRVKTFSAVASIAAVSLVVTLGAVLVKDTNTEPPVGSLHDLAASARLEPGATDVVLQSGDQLHSATMVMTADGHGYLENGNLPTLEADQTYQLWAFTNSGQPVSVAVLGGTFSDVAFMAHAQVSTVAITVEPAGGVPAPTSLPLVSAALA